MRKDTNRAEFSIFQSQSALTLLWYGLTALLIVVLPLIIWRLRLPFVEQTFSGAHPGTVDSQPIEVFGFLISVALVSITWGQVRKYKIKTLSDLAPIVLPLAVSLNGLFVIVEHSHAKSSDYMCYQNAGAAVVNALNPFTGNPACYLYPPLPAQFLGFIYQAVHHSALLPPALSDKAWDVVFYFYQCIQFFQLTLAYFLTYLLAQTMGLKSFQSLGLVSGLFLFNFPLVRTLEFSQVNLWILNCFLLAVLLLQRFPLLSGLAIALGGHIKLYPLILLLPWGITQKFRAISGALLSFLAILILQTKWGTDWTLWQQFFGYFKNVEKPSNYRNNSIWSLVFNFFKIPQLIFHTSWESMVPIVVTVLNIAILIWFVARIIHREQIYAKLSKTIHPSHKELWNKAYRFCGHSVDTIALSLLISPSVWEHHYVLAIPMALWAVITCRTEHPLRTWIGVLLIFWLPSFEIFPISYHRLLGLLFLVYLTSPTATERYFRHQMDWSKEINGVNQSPKPVT
jgi:Glycosyltransferase family 87